MPLKHIPKGKGVALFGSFPSPQPQKSVFRAFLKNKTSSRLCQAIVSGRDREWMVLNVLNLSSYGPEWGKPLSLFTNAIQAMDGQRAPSLSTKSRNGMVAVPIGATGSGNSKEFMGRIFTHFSPSNLSANGPDWGFMPLSLSLPNTKGRFP